MTFHELTKMLSEREGVSEREVQYEMQRAIQYAGLSCSPQEFIEEIVCFIKRKDYIS